jgi:N-acetylmuramoyl-L-alanine amidase
MLLLFTLLAGATIVIDPGHGGFQPGARAGGGRFEKELTLEMAQTLRHELEAHGHKVFLTRDADRYVALGARSRLANQHNADILISLHANDSPSRQPGGIETYFLSSHASDAQAQALADRENGEGDDELSARELLDSILSDLRRANAQIESELLAARVQGAAVKATGAKNRGVKQAPLAVLKHIEMAGVLVEMGFLTNPDESRKLWSAAYQQTLAQGIAAGVERFLSDVQDGMLPEIPPESDAPEISLTDRARTSANAAHPHAAPSHAPKWQAAPVSAHRQLVVAVRRSRPRPPPARPAHKLRRVARK